MDYSRYETLSITIDDKVLTVALDRPDALNAVNARMHDELTWIWEDVQNDDDVALVVLTGNGKAFCAGGDINWMAGEGEGRAMNTMTAYLAKKLIFNLLDCEKPIICSLNGDALALGPPWRCFATPSLPAKTRGSATRMCGQAWLQAMAVPSSGRSSSGIQEQKNI